MRTAVDLLWGLLVNKAQRDPRVGVQRRCRWGCSCGGRLYNVACRRLHTVACRRLDIVACCRLYIVACRRLYMAWQNVVWQCSARRSCCAAQCCTSLWADPCALTHHPCRAGLLYAVHSCVIAVHGNVIAVHRRAIAVHRRAKVAVHRRAVTLAWAQAHSTLCKLCMICTL